MTEEAGLQTVQSRAREEGCLPGRGWEGWSLPWETRLDRQNLTSTQTLP